MDYRIAAFRDAIEFAGGRVDEIDGLRCRLSLNELKAHPVQLILAGLVFPRDAREIAWRAADVKSEGLLPIVTAEAVSDGARALFRKHSISYADQGRSLFLSLPPAFVFIDRPAPKREKRVVKSVLSGKTALAAHVLLAAREPIQGSEITRLSGLSAASVSGAMDKLDRMGWLSTTGSGPRKTRVLADRRGLMEQWRLSRGVEGPVRKETFYVPGVSDARKLAEKVAAAANAVGADYLLSGPFGAQMHAPYLSMLHKVYCRIRKTEIANVLASIGAKHVGEGWNLAIIESDLPENEIFRREIEGLWVASPLVCWVDTVSEGGRNPELADHLLQERIL
mgnify:CR=1 FL=1|jgi:Uncharacterized protein conserved in bacteria